RIRRRRAGSTKSPASGNRFTRTKKRDHAQTLTPVSEPKRRAGSIRKATMKLGINSVLFGGHDLETAFKYTQLCGYDGIEISAIDGMSEHLVLDRWREIAPKVKALSRQYNLPVMAMEQPSQDPARMEQ